MIINGQRYEAEPAVEAYVKDLQAENEEQRREILRLTDELKEMDEANEYFRNQSTKDFENVLKFMDTIGALKKENAQLRCLVKKLIKLYIPYMPAIRGRDGLIDIKTAFGYDLDKLLGEDWRDKL